MNMESVSANVKYGFGAIKEVGFDMKEFDATRVMVVTDQNLVDKEPVKVNLQSLEDEGLNAVLYPSRRIEPTGVSSREAAVVPATINSIWRL